MIWTATVRRTRSRLVHHLMVLVSGAWRRDGLVRLLVRDDVGLGAHWDVSRGRLVRGLTTRVIQWRVLLGVLSVAGPVHDLVLKFLLRVDHRMWAGLQGRLR